MTRILMIEDDQKQLKKMKNLLESSDRHYDCFCARTEREGLQLVNQHKMDIVILDIGIQNKSGIELAQEIRKIPGYEFVWIIFVTAHRQYLTEAFQKTHCYDYLVKPYDAEVLLGTIELLSRYKTTITTPDDIEFVTFKQRDRYFRILTKDILFIEVIGNNSMLYTYSHVFPLRKMSLKKLKFSLPDYFVQCHKSYIVNRNYIEEIRKTSFGWEIKLLNYDTPIPNGEKYKDFITGIIGVC